MVSGKDAGEQKAKEGKLKKTREKIGKKSEGDGKLQAFDSVNWSLEPLTSRLRGTNWQA